MVNTTFATSHTITTELGRIQQATNTVATKLLQLSECTLNHKYNVLTDAKITTFPRIRYFGIGINGCANISTENNIVQPYQPLASNMDLYTPIPFRCVKTPLDKDEAAKYRMVTTTTIGGVKYYQYWLKMLEFESDVPKLTSIEGNTESSYTLDPSNLYPVPKILNGTDISNSGGSRTEVTIPAIRRVTGAEVCEVINAMFNGDMRRASISEFGLYSGIEMQNQHTEGISYNYTEAAYVQLVTHTCMIGHIFTSEKDTYVDRCIIQNGALSRI